MITGTGAGFKIMMMAFSFSRPGWVGERTGRYRMVASAWCGGPPVLAGRNRPAAPFTAGAIGCVTGPSDAGLQLPAARQVPAGLARCPGPVGHRCDPVASGEPAVNCRAVGFRVGASCRFRKVGPSGAATGLLRLQRRPWSRSSPGAASNQRFGFRWLVRGRLLSSRFRRGSVPLRAQPARRPPRPRRRSTPRRRPRNARENGSAEAAPTRYPGHPIRAVLGMGGAKAHSRPYTWLPMNLLLDRRGRHGPFWQPASRTSVG